MLGPGWNPEREMGWDEPHALVGRNLHDATDGIDQLIGSVCVLGDLKPGWVFVGERGNANARLRIVFPKNRAMSQ